MKQGDTVISKINKTSGKSGRIFLKAGDKIKILAIHGDTLICETKKERISINKNDVQL